MPDRIIREYLLFSSRVDTLSFEAEVFYRRLMSKADDYGRYDGRLAMLRSQLFALRIDQVKEPDVARWLKECVDAGVILYYEVDGEPYVEIQDFNQRLRTESKYPHPPGKEAEEAALLEVAHQNALTFARESRSNDRPMRMRKRSTNSKAKTRASTRLPADDGADEDGPFEAPDTGSPPGSHSNSPTRSPSRSRSSPDSQDDGPPSGEGELGSEEDLRSLVDFNAFWEAYPRKCQRAAALQAWKDTAADRPPLEELLKSLKTQKRSAQWVNDDGEFIPYPKTWLSQHRWADHIDPPPTPCRDSPQLATKEDIERALRL